MNFSPDKHLDTMTQIKYENNNLQGLVSLRRFLNFFKENSIILP